MSCRTCAYCQSGIQAGFAMNRAFIFARSAALGTTAVGTPNGFSLCFAARAGTSSRRERANLLDLAGLESDNQLRLLDEDRARAGADRPFIGALEIPGVVDLLLAENEAAIRDHPQAVGHRLAVGRVAQHGGHVHAAFRLVGRHLRRAEFRGEAVLGGVRAPKRFQ